VADTQLAGRDEYPAEILDGKRPKS